MGENEIDERSPLLNPNQHASNINEIIIDVPVNDEGSCLNNILHKTASNIIDVAATDSYIFDQNEFMDRTQYYKTVLSNISPLILKQIAFKIDKNLGSSCTYWKHEDINKLFSGEVSKSISNKPQHGDTKHTSRYSFTKMLNIGGKGDYKNKSGVAKSKTSKNNLTLNIEEDPQIYLNKNPHFSSQGLGEEAIISQCKYLCEFNRSKKDLEQVQIIEKIDIWYENILQALSQIKIQHKEDFVIQF
ncbi:unnamed protein product [Gordionus sp. m RMFG-2023]